MSDEPDRDSQTEEPTEKRIREAKERGDTPVSSEVSLAASLLVLAGAGIFMASRIALEMGTWLASLFEHLSDFRLENGAELESLASHIASFVGVALIPVAAALMLSGIVTCLGQSGLVIGWDKLAPSFGRLSPARGLSKIFGRGARGELLKSLGKIAIGGGVVYVWFRSEWRILLAASGTEEQGLPGTMIAGLTRLFVTAGLVHSIIAFADLMWVRIRWRVEHRMSKEEVKREHRESDMDPALKSKMRALSNARARRRMMAAVPTATVIIANPTHLAIALRFVRERDAAPVVVAKGADQIALRIRERAAAHNVPIIEDRPLARAMYEMVELDKPIPIQFYKAVAVIIHHLSRRGAITPSRR